MVTTAPLRFLLVLLLAAWTTLCCCERRAIAEALFGGACAESTFQIDRVAPRCCSACTSAESPVGVVPSGEGRVGGSGEPARAPGCCSDDCRLKATTPPMTFELAIDSIGVELPSSRGDADPGADGLHRAPGRELREPHPPPWRILVVSARLRI